jgi:hypothetical protein
VLPAWYSISITLPLPDVISTRESPFVAQSAADPSPYIRSDARRMLGVASFLLASPNVRIALRCAKRGEPVSVHSFGCKANAWRCILFARVAERSLSFAFLLFSANLSGTHHHLTLPCDCLLGKPDTSYMSPIVSFVQSRHQGSTATLYSSSSSASRSTARFSVASPVV